MADDRRPQAAAARPALIAAGRLLRRDEAASVTEAEALLERAQAALAEAEAERARAYGEGRAAGYAQGLAEAAQLVESARAGFGRVVDQLEKPVREMVFTIVERILGAGDHGDLVARAVRHALDGLKEHSRIRLTVAPEAVEPLQRMLAERGAAAPEVVTIEADRRLRPDQCVLQSELGYVELGPKAQLANLRDDIARDPAQGLAPLGSKA